MTLSTILAGFGGQGILFAGKIMAYAGLLEEKFVSWLPSYGPEMRGGTANCSVCLSDQPIGSPLVLEPDLLLVMNLPSYEKFIDHVRPGGVAVIDSALIDRKCPREDIRCCYIPATTMADEEGVKGLANIIMLGKALKEGGFAALQSVEQAVSKCISPRKQNLMQPNLEAMHLGYTY